MTKCPDCERLEAEVADLRRQLGMQHAWVRSFYNAQKRAEEQVKTLLAELKALKP